MFDTKSKNQANPQHHLKSFNKHRSEDKYDYPLEGEKKMIKFYRNYIIEVKAERQDQDRIQIYDFDNKIILFSVNYKEIVQVETEDGAIYMQVKDRDGRSSIHQLIETENNIKI